MKGHTVAGLGSAETSEQRGKLIDPDVEFLVRDCLGRFSFRLWYPEQCCLVAIGRQVTIDAIVTRVEPTADEPLPERRVTRVQCRVPVMIPGEQIRVLLETLRKVFLTESFIDARIASIGLPNELWRGLIILLLSPVDSNLCFGDYFPLFICHDVITSDVD